MPRVYLPHIPEQLEAFHTAMDMIRYGMGIQYPVQPDQIVRFAAELLFLDIPRYLPALFSYVFRNEAIHSKCPSFAIEPFVKQLLPYLQSADLSWNAAFNIITILSESLDCMLLNCIMTSIVW